MSSLMGGEFPDTEEAAIGRRRRETEADEDADEDENEDDHGIWGFGCSPLALRMWEVRRDAVVQ